jgi:hypothetical protein
MQWLANPNISPVPTESTKDTTSTTEMITAFYNVHTIAEVRSHLS